MSRPLRTCAATAALLALVAGCTHEPSPAPAGLQTAKAAQPPAALTAFDSCAQLLREFRAATIRDPAAATALSPATPRALPAAPFSGTTVQEQGVDEPDTVKTDGRRIVTVGNGVLHVIDPATRKVTGRLDLGLVGAEHLLLAGDHALVLGMTDLGMAPLTPGGPAIVPGGSTPFPRGAIAVPGGPAALPRPFGGGTALVLVDLAGAPRVISRYRGDGRLLDARQTGNVARIVLSTSPRITFPLRATTPAGAARENRAAINAAPIDAWLPGWEITTGTTTTRGRLGCGSVVRPATLSGTGLLTVLSLDLAAPQLGDGDPLGIVAGGDTVYATPGSLYVADDQVTGPVWRHPVAPVGTAIYRFAVPAGPGRPTYAGFGRVPGTLLGSSAMSEWAGYLRVATTSANVSTVRVLRVENGRLVQVGAVSGLGNGEQIFAVRFLGPRGYVVTYRQIDPLYSLDLSDPAHPRVIGSVQLTGYSAALVPVGDGRLAGIGQAATAQGRTLGTQISLFDVAGPGAARRLAQVPLTGASSQAEYDPHAVLWWPTAGLLVVPISTDSAREAALAVRVSADGLRTVTRIAVPSGVVSRQLIAGDALWIMTDTGLLATPLSALSTPAAATWLPLR